MKILGKEKSISIVLALVLGLIIGSFSVSLAHAQINKANKLNNKKSIILDNNIITLKDGKKIRAFNDDNYGVILQEFVEEQSSWIDKDKIGKVEIKEMKATDDGGYTVTYLDKEKDNYFKYKQFYDKNSNKIDDEEVIGIEIEIENNNIISMDLLVDKDNNITTIKFLTEEVVVKDFTPVSCSYIDGNNIVINGQGVEGIQTVVIVTCNGRVISGDIIKDSEYIAPEYTKVKLLGVSEVDNEKFIVSGYAVKDENSNKKDGFFIQFDKEGNKESEAKIISSSYGKNNDASINNVIRLDGNNIRVEGPNLPYMYIVSSSKYSDSRKIKDSLRLSNGKRYKVVEEAKQLVKENKNLTEENKEEHNLIEKNDDAFEETIETYTFTVKSISENVEYDIATFKGVRDIKLIPGNNNQVLIAVTNIDNTTEISIINTKDDADIDESGVVISKVVSIGEIKQNGEPIEDIDIKTIKVNTDGKVLLRTTNSSEFIEVDIHNIESGTPIDIIYPKPPIDINPDEIPSIEEDRIVNVDNGEVIIFDRSNPTNIKVISSKLENKDIEYILINGIKITKTIIEGYNNNEAYFNVGNGFIILSTKLFEDLNLDIKDNYIVGIRFADDSEITELAKLNIVDNSKNNIIINPEDKGNNNINNTNIKVEQNSEENTKTDINSEVSPVITLVLGIISALVGCVPIIRGK